jgi:hypothetical protein
MSGIEEIRKEMTPEQVKSYERIVKRYGEEPDESGLMIGGDGCVMVHFKMVGIWIGIETDGYAHS